jgi:hypothetical protein
MEEFDKYEKSFSHVLVGLILIFVLLLVSFGDFCITSHATCCKQMEQMDFNHNIICKEKHEKDEACIKFLAIVSEIQNVTITKLQFDPHENVTPVKMESIQDLYGNQFNIWMVRKRGLFTRYFQLSQKTNFTSYQSMMEMDEDSFDHILLFHNKGKNYFAHVTIQGWDVYILIK